MNTAFVVLVAFAVSEGVFLGCVMIFIILLCIKRNTISLIPEPYTNRSYIATDGEESYSVLTSENSSPFQTASIVMEVESSDQDSSDQEITLPSPDSLKREYEERKIQK